MTFPYFVLCGVVGLLWLAAVAYTRRERRLTRERQDALLERLATAAERDARLRSIYERAQRERTR